VKLAGFMFASVDGDAAPLGGSLDMAEKLAG